MYKDYENEIVASSFEEFDQYNLVYKHKFYLLKELGYYWEKHTQCNMLELIGH